MSSNTKHTKKAFAVLFGGIVAVALCITPASAQAADLEVTGWMPYWAASKSISDARKHLEELDEIHPFGFSVQNDGDLKDLFGLKKSAWKRLAKAAESENVRVVPTVMWSDGYMIHQILSDEDKRADHIEAIVEMVEKGNFDGVDIDYESKWAETKDYFSLFLKELKEELDGKMLTCAIEARTPPSSLYKTIPNTIQYANDYKEIGKHCDRVQIMGYDQGRADIKLNDEKSGAPYIPNADVDWIRKVVKLTAETIPKEKIVLGVPTYGNEYEVTVAPNWFQSYRKLWSLNPKYAEDTAEDYDVEPSPSKAGELSFSYIAEDSPTKLSRNLSIPRNTPSGDEIAAKALAHANKTGETVTFNYVTWSDADAVAQKVALAKELGIKGIAIFKIDGGEDKDIWDLFE